MPHTDGRWTQGTSNPDLQLFIGAQKFKDLAGLATTPATIATPGLLWQLVPAGDACIFVAELDELMLRAGVYATPAYDQEQFGTAASQPGPSSVSGTSGPLAIPGSGTPNFQGFPPIPSALMATLAGPVSGPTQKGIQIDSVDVIYQVLADATAVAATMGLTKTTFSNLAAPVVTNLIALGANGLPVVIGAQPQVTNVLVPTPGMIVAADTEVLLNINLTGGTAGTIKFFGAVIKAHFNLN
jgi:hypothetical protein